MNSIEQQIWGFTPEGEAVVRYTMTNAGGASVVLSNIGAGIIAVNVPDRNGKLANVALGYDRFESYFGDGPYMGKTPGRFANRIGEGRFTLDGKEYRLAQNSGGQHLHGGLKGFANKVWAGRVETDRVVFSLVSPDGDDKYPGEVTVEVCYDWNDDCELEITYYAKTDAPTIINLTNHSYFNLKGESAGRAMEQELQLNASKFLWYDKNCIPTGELVEVKGTPMDFTTAKPLARDIDADYEPLNIGHGYDQSWAIDGYEKGKLSEAGVLSDPETGRRMRIFTTHPSAHVYAGNFLQGCPTSISGHEYANRDGVAIECQGYPNSPNRPNFPSTVLRPDELYNEKIIFRFETDNK